MPVKGRLVAACLLPLALAGAASCSQPVDFKQTLQVTDVSGGWFDAGIVDGKNKLVPSITFRIKKPANVRLNSVSLNVHFKKVVDPSKPGLEGEQEFEEVFLQTVAFAEGPQTALMTVRSPTGVTGDAQPFAVCRRPDAAGYGSGGSCRRTDRGRVLYRDHPLPRQ